MCSNTLAFCIINGTMRRWEYARNTAYVLQWNSEAKSSERTWWSSDNWIVEVILGTILFDCQQEHPHSKNKERHKDRVEEYVEYDDPPWNTQEICVRKLSVQIEFHN